MGTSYYQQKGGDIILNVYLQPSSSKDEIVGGYGEYLKIKIKAAPVENKANENLKKFLAKILNVSISQIEIIKGHQTKRKMIRIKNLDKGKFQLLCNEAGKYL